MQAALISILTGEYTVQAMPIAHYRHQPPGMFVRLISGGITQPTPSPSCCGAQQQNTNASRTKRIQVGWEVGEGQPGEGKGARQGGGGGSASLQHERLAAGKSEGLGILGPFRHSKLRCDGDGR